MQPKTLFILVVYMIMVYTTIGVFTAGADEFVFGGERPELQNIGSVDYFTHALSYIAKYNLTGAEAFAFMNETFGEYQGVRFVWSLFPPKIGDYHWWIQPSSNVVTEVSKGDFDDILAGEPIEVDNGFISTAVRVLGSIADAISYLFGLLTFNILSPTFSDGTVMPGFLTWIPLMMVLPVWIAIVYWLYPTLIHLVQALGSLLRVPFSG